MDQRPLLPKLLTAGLLGLLTAYAISITFYRNDLTNPFEWIVTLSLLALGFGFVIFMLLPAALKISLDVPVEVRVWGITLAGASGAFFSWNLGFIFLLPFALAGYLLISYTFPALHEIYSGKRTFRFLFAWGVSLGVAFFAAGYFKNYYPSFIQFLLLTVLLTSILTALIEGLLEHFLSSLRTHLIEKVISMAVLVLGLSWLVLTIRTLVQYPDFFSSGFFIPIPRLTPVFFGTAILSQALAAFLAQRLDVYNWKASQPFLWINRNLPGLLLAITLGISTYLLATALVSEEILFLDIFFQMDSPWWVNFLTGDPDRLLIMRFVHPFVLLILRPPVWLISLFLNGNTFHAALLFNNIVGGVCVFLAWLFFKRRTGNTAYALLMAFLLGISNAHLALSTFLESYIFSAAALITFMLLLQARESRFPHFVLAGLVTFGITITNFVQTCIGLLVIRRDFKLVFRYGVIVLALATVLAFIQHIFYPTSDPLYLTSRYKSEETNIRDYSDLETNRAIRDFQRRTNVMFRNTTLFSVVAPRPIIRFEGAGCNPLCFRMVHRERGTYRFASYVGFGSLLARSWFLGLVVAGLIYAWRLIKTRDWSTLQTVLLLNVLFNFALHLVYGTDPLIYTPNWTYALVFFFGISFESLGNRPWWQILLLAFLTGLLVNNLGLFNTILENLLPFFP